MMISGEEWWGIMEDYSARIYPAQIIFYVIAILFIGWLFPKPGRIKNFLLTLYLLIAFAWNGIVFFLILAKDITGSRYGNYLFGSIFIIVSLLFTVAFVGSPVSAVHSDSQVWRLRRYDHAGDWSLPYFIFILVGFSLDKCV